MVHESNVLFQDGCGVAQESVKSYRVPEAKMGRSGPENCILSTCFSNHMHFVDAVTAGF